MARASAANSIIFVRTSNGKIFHANRRWEIDLTSEFGGSNATDRSCYAKLAGVRVKDIEAARKALREAEQKKAKKRDADALKATAAKHGFRLVRVDSAHAG